MKKILAVLSLSIIICLSLAVNCFAMGDEPVIYNEEHMDLPEGVGFFDYVADPQRVYPTPSDFETMINALPTYYVGDTATFYFDSYLLFFDNDLTYDGVSKYINVIMWDSTLHSVEVKKSGTGTSHYLSSTKLVDSVSKNAFRTYYWDPTEKNWLLVSDTATSERIFPGDDIYCTTNLLKGSEVYYIAGNSVYYQEYLDAFHFTYPFADGLKAVWSFFGNIGDALPGDIIKVVSWAFCALIVVGILKAF